MSCALWDCVVKSQIEQGTLHSKCQLSLVSQTPAKQYRYTILGWVPVATRPRNTPSRFPRKLGDPTAYWPVHTEYTGSRFPRRPHCKWGGGGQGQICALPFCGVRPRSKPASCKRCATVFFRVRGASCCHRGVFCDSFLPENWCWLFCQYSQVIHSERQGK